jgi:heterodisulfide reductase subunit C
MSPAQFQTVLYASLAVCALGLLWRAAAWFRLGIGPGTRTTTSSQRLAAALRCSLAALFSRRLFRLSGVFFLDALLLRRLFAVDRLRWLGHLLVLTGFTLLTLMHALAPLVSAQLFRFYQPTLDPYLLLRNLFGAMVLTGVALMLYSRRRSGPAQARGPAAVAFVMLLGLVLVSGFLLEAHKLASPRAFHRMTAQYLGGTDAGELGPLRALWASEFGVAFDDLKRPIDPRLVEQGRKLHREACAACHAQPASAFVSYAVARALAPVAAAMDAARADIWLLYLHVYACFLGLASLPFTGLFHALASPLGLLAHASPPRRAPAAAGRAVRRALALDACVQCGICDARCAVAPLARYLGNPLLLPSHKLRATGALAEGKLLRPGREREALRAADGAFLCTDCGRCTSRCPVGLDLEDLWQAGRGDLAALGLPAPAQWVQARPAFAWAEALDAGSAAHAALGADAASAPLAAERSSFSRCVQCQTCTNVCPVVAHGLDSAQGVDLTPQKVMNLLRLGLYELALGSRMVWDCAACYQCQESCPEGIRVADILCELRALAVQRLGAVRAWGAPQ